MWYLYVCVVCGVCAVRGVFGGDRCSKCLYIFSDVPLCHDGQWTNLHTAWSLVGDGLPPWWHVLSSEAVFSGASHTWRFQSQSSQRLGNLERCSWKTWRWKLQWQWAHITWTVRWTTTVYHQQCVQIETRIKSHLDASSMKHWHIVDHILLRQRDLKGVIHTRVMATAKCHTDRRLILCKLRFHLKPKPRLGCARK